MKFSMHEILPVYEVKADNFANPLINKIHSPDVAQTYGFSDGLVPGIAIYAYMTHPIVSVLGKYWLKNGYITAKFIKPVYHGETLHVHCQVAQLQPLSLDIKVFNSTNTLCAVGMAGFSDDAPALLSANYPEHPLPQPENLFPAQVQAISPGTPLGSIFLELDDDDPEAYFFEDIQKSHPLFQSPDPILHPAFILLFANLIVMKNVDLGPWIHVSSNIKNFTLPFTSEKFMMRGKVKDSYLKKGNDFLVLDLAVFNETNEPVAHIEHSAIIRLK